MSGGHFDYAQHSIEEIADSIEDYLEGHELDDSDIKYYCEDKWLEEEANKYIRENKHTVPNPYGFNDETLSLFKKGLRIIKEAYVYAQRIDWLLSGDDGEETFKERLEEDLKTIR